MALAGTKRRSIFVAPHKEPRRERGRGATSTSSLASDGFGSRGSKRSAKLTSGASRPVLRLGRMACGVFGPSEDNDIPDESTCRCFLFSFFFVQLSLKSEGCTLKWDAPQPKPTWGLWGPLLGCQTTAPKWLPNPKNAETPAKHVTVIRQQIAYLG